MTKQIWMLDDNDDFYLFTTEELALEWIKESSKGWTYPIDPEELKPQGVRRVIASCFVLFPYQIMTSKEDFYI